MIRIRKNSPGLLLAAIVLVVGGGACGPNRADGWYRNDKGVNIKDLAEQWKQQLAVTQARAKDWDETKKPVARYTELDKLRNRTSAQDDVMRRLYDQIYALHPELTKGCQTSVK